MTLMRMAPMISGESYRSRDMVRAVNLLRRLGKSEALRVLTRHLQANGPTGDPREGAKVFLVCRLLFVTPDGWGRLKLGRPVPEINWSAAEQFPLFPIALSDGVPFLLVNGYRTGGVVESPEACLRLCETLSIISTDLPEDNHAKAAHALVQSEAFRRLYLENGDRKRMAEMVVRESDK